MPLKEGSQRLREITRKAPATRGSQIFPGKIQAEGGPEHPRKLCAKWKIPKEIQVCAMFSVASG